MKKEHFEEIAESIQNDIEDRFFFTTCDNLDGARFVLGEDLDEDGPSDQPDLAQILIDSDDDTKKKLFTTILQNLLVEYK